MDYKNGKIYAIRSPNTEKIYIGSTTTELRKRFYQHKRKYNKYKRSGKKCTCSWVIFEACDPYIELIENYPCADKNELNRREGQFIRKHKDICCNRCVAGRSIKEWQTDNKDKIAKINKKFYEKHKDKLAKKQKEYYEKNKDIIAKRYQKDKEKLAVKTTCTHCGKVMRKDSITRHIRKSCKKAPAQEPTN